MITIDGSQGEGGGQILRTSLALSLVTGQPFRMERVRAKRQKPGLLKQHLTAVEAAKTVGCAEVTGAALGSQTLEFTPGPVTPGNYRFAVGTAGSATLVLQTVLPALLTASGLSTLTLPTILLLALGAQPLAALFVAVTAVALFAGLTRPSVRLWLNEP